MSKKTTAPVYAILVLAALLLVACGSGPQRKTENARCRCSGEAGAATPAGSGATSAETGRVRCTRNLDEIPDAVPKNEPLHRYANPLPWRWQDLPPVDRHRHFKQRGIASWYGKKFPRPSALGRRGV